MTLGKWLLVLAPFVVAAGGLYAAAQIGKPRKTGRPPSGDARPPAPPGDGDA